MIFEVRYRVTPGYDMFDDFPILQFKYRQKGKWSYRTQQCALDEHAKNLGYGGYCATWDLDVYSLSARVKYFQNALSDKYGGDINKYIFEYIKRMIIEETKAENHEMAVKAAISGLLINDWQSIQIEIMELEEA